MLTFVWAEDRKHQIGLNGHLPWNLPADMQHFKDLTMGHPMIMGRKTFASFPKPLPGRKHIVLTRDRALMQKYAQNDQVIILMSLNELDDWLLYHQDEELCVIGGAEVFQALLGRADRLEQTIIDAEFSGDTVMPEIDYSQFDLIKNDPHQPDGKNKYPYTFLTYTRKAGANHA
ncbi:dihydrofolate reductase [Lactobacillus sp. ESL0791]|uniref:dihydrofolate reductase n=1 Tax=Lactobacillus sp. ESL0791 TaxID=2983234 RepID=UPI0023F8CEE7|nr:dihydrofolate reductase [Lactobacillus sp. ESL0791]MDF7639035.1 dihydrofolate reductase [Lactobacillus sp. ESL0791]